MSNSDFPLVHSKFGNKDSCNFVFIGGSTMAGKGISSPAYPELFAHFSGFSIEVYTKYLIKLGDVISLIQANNITSENVVIQCGGGDQMRMINPILKKLFPSHWSAPAHLEPPLIYSSQTKKKIRQKGVLFIKYLVKYLIKNFGLYPNSTKIETYVEQLKQLSFIAHARNLKICWIDTPLGDYRIPSFIRREKESYCRLLVKRSIENFPTGSYFLSLEGSIDNGDLLDDAFHLSVAGHQKVCKMLLVNNQF